MLTIAGNITDESIPRTAIIFIAQAEGLQGYATHRLYRALLEDTSMLGLLQVAIWCIGEYGDSLTRVCQVPNGDGSYSALTENEVLALLDKCAKLHNADMTTKALVINALMKLSVRFSPSVKQTVIELIAPYRHSLSLELQQRSSEYSILLSAPQYDHLRKDLLDKMPILEESAIRKRRAAFEGENTGSDNGSSKVDLMASGVSSISLSSAAVASKPAINSGASLLDLDDIFGGSSPAPVATSAPAPAPVSAAAKSTHDLLGEIFSSTPIAPAAPQPNAGFGMPMQPNPFGMMPPAAPLNPMGGMMSPSPMAPMMSMAPAPVPAQIPAAMPMIATNLSQTLSIVAFEKNGLLITMDVTKPNSSDLSQTKLICKFSNASGMPLENFVFQVIAYSLATSLMVAFN
jgi:AP-1 complex subunit gamma-1